MTAQPPEVERPELLHPRTPHEVDPAHRVPVSYIDKSREYYAAQGYPAPYRWAHHLDAPFTRLPRPLAESRIGLVTTAIYLEGFEPGDAEPDAETLPVPHVHTGPTDPPPPRLYTQARSWDKEATHTDDVESFLPVRALQHFIAEGRVGSLAPRFVSVPTDYSQRRTDEVDAPEVLRLLREDGVEAAVLVPL
jgi:hypothetical protein